MKPHTIKRFRAVLVAIALLLPSCSRETSESSTQDAGDKNKPVICTVNYPLAYFAQRIGGKHLTIEFSSIKGDPAFWQPKAADVNKFQVADLILINGASYAKWLSIASLPQSKIVNTSAAFKDQYIDQSNSIKHAHGPSGEHDHGRIAFTTWLDPALAIMQAKAICRAFVREFPGHEAYFEKRYEELKLDLQKIDNALEHLLSDKQDVPLIMSHPIYQYLERRYGINAKRVLGTRCDSK